MLAGDQRRIRWSLWWGRQDQSQVWLFREVWRNRMKWCTPLISALGRQRQMEASLVYIVKSKSSLSYIVRP